MPCISSRSIWLYIYIAKIRNTNQKIFICDECEAVWESEKDILKNSFKEFEDYMLEKGLKPVWTELKDIEKKWYTR
ncbi:hypothetical protein [Clostridium oceanicum]|uniref:Transcription factor zinc-finger domain-containing protein n=1 Tax=Clostridium oceanicum TaxID=1543 RepID=A0ABP3UY23_9CLOT